MKEIWSLINIIPILQTDSFYNNKYMEKLKKVIQIECFSPYDSLCFSTALCNIKASSFIGLFEIYIFIFCVRNIFKTTPTFIVA